MLWKSFIKHHLEKKKQTTKTYYNVIYSFVFLRKKAGQFKRVVCMMAQKEKQQNKIIFIWFGVEWASRALTLRLLWLQLWLVWISKSKVIRNYGTGKCVYSETFTTKWVKWSISRYISLSVGKVQKGTEWIEHRKNERTNKQTNKCVCLACSLHLCMYVI